MTPHEWLQTCRVERAKDMMMAADLSLAEVALACGFADQSHFTRIFTRKTGSTPGAWKRLRRAA
jgi:AraC family transcriptional regulator